MRNSLLIIAILFLCSGCKDSFNDKDKRNENWVWWVDAKTGKSSWIHAGPDQPQVQNGKYTRFYFNGNIYEKGKLVNAEPVDTIFDFDIYGHPSEYRLLSNDTDEYGEKSNKIEYYYKNGPGTFYYPDGSVEAKGIVENHKAGNKWILFFKGGLRKHARKINNGTGWILSYFDNGRIRDSFSVYKDTPYLIKRYYRMGQLAKSIDFKNHSFNGFEREYYLNGRLKFICPIINGELDGKSKKWYEDGHLMEVSCRKNDKLNGGPDTAYYESGKIKMIASAKNDQLDGEVKMFDESGKLTVDKIFKENVVVEDKLKPSLLISK